MLGCQLAPNLAILLQMYCEVGKCAIRPGEAHMLPDVAHLGEGFRSVSCKLQIQRFNVRSALWPAWVSSAQDVVQKQICIVAEHEET